MIIGGLKTAFFILATIILTIWYRNQTTRNKIPYEEKSAPRSIWELWETFGSSICTGGILNANDDYDFDDDE